MGYDLHASRRAGGPIATAVAGWMLLWLAVLAVGLALAAPPAAARGEGPGDESAFTDAVAEAFAEALPNAQVTVRGPLALRITGLPDGPVQSDLHNLYNFCQRVPDRCERAVALQVGQMADSYQHVEAPSRERLRGIVRTTPFVDAIRRQEEPIAQKLIGDLWMICALDLPQAFQMMKSTDLTALNLSREAALTVCRDNVAAALPPVGAMVRDYPRPGINIVTGDDYGASQILFPERWAAEAQALGGSLLAVVPATDVVLYTSGRRADAVAMLEAAAAYVTARAPRPLSHVVLRWTPKGWEEAKR